jgi:hypothetical protein
MKDGRLTTKNTVTASRKNLSDALGVQESVGLAPQMYCNTRS